MYTKLFSTLYCKITTNLFSFIQWKMYNSFLDCFFHLKKQMKKIKITIYSEALSVFKFKLLQLWITRIHVYVIRKVFFLMTTFRKACELFFIKPSVDILIFCRISKNILLFELVIPVIFVCFLFCFVLFFFFSSIKLNEIFIISKIQLVI